MVSCRPQLGVKSSSAMDINVNGFKFHEATGSIAAGLMLVNSSPSRCESQNPRAWSLCRAFKLHEASQQNASGIRLEAPPPLNSSCIKWFI